MTRTKPRALRATALSLAVAGMMLTTSLNAGVINNSNNVASTGDFLGDCTATPLVPGSTKGACVGALNLNNVQVDLVRVSDGSVFGTFDKTTGDYTPMTVGDSFVGLISDGFNTVMAKLTGKNWPVGEPNGIKAVINDPNVKSGKPANCLINTSFLSATDSGNAAAAYLDTAHPRPVICSSPFQTHKRFKFSMQPATVDGVANGAEGKGIDLVFNVADDGTLRPYEVFSKINNYTGKRLKGYKIVVGKGLGVNFKSASTLNIADKLHISIGISEGASSGKTPVLDGSNSFDEDGLATFSHGLFGAPDKHFTANGFFDSRTTGFNVAQTCSTLPCTTYPGDFAGSTLTNSDTIYSTTAMPSNYATLFGDWLPSVWQPQGIFWDFDNDPATDADLIAWWDGAVWRKNNDSGFAVASQAELNTWTQNPLYAIKGVEDVLNLGINYIVKVGDGIGPDITVRIIPVVADTQVAPSYVATPPPALVDSGSGTVVDNNTPTVVTPDPVDDVPVLAPVTPAATSSSGGGCTTATGNAPFDPMLPLLAALGVIGLGVRRLRRR